jgi:hypothetical protein
MRRGIFLPAADRRRGAPACRPRLPIIPRLHSIRGNTMEAERVNALAANVDDLNTRLGDLRRYL